MKSKILVGTLLLLPIAAICLFSLSKPTQSGVVMVPQGTNPMAMKTSTHPTKMAAPKQGGLDPEVQAFLKKSEDERSERHFERAERASRQDIENYPSNESFLLSKHRSTFDTWGLSTSQRNKIVKSVDSHTKEFAIAWRDSDRSWPLEVGHVANKSAHLEHLKNLVQRGNDLKAKLRLELEAAAGTEFANEFMARNYTSTGQGKNKPASVD